MATSSDQEENQLGDSALPKPTRLACAITEFLATARIERYEDRLSDEDKKTLAALRYIQRTSA